MEKHRVRQHIVPQAYLKKFAQKNVNNSGANISIYQKENNRQFNCAVKNVAFEKNYYDVTNKENTKYWEEHFATHIEPLYGNELTNIISSIMLSNSNENVLNPSQKFSLAMMIVFQIIRVPKFLKGRFQNGEVIFDETIRELIQLMPMEFISKNIEVLEDLKRERKNLIKDITIELIAQHDMLDRLAKYIENRTWLFYVNNSEVPFVTSDNPALMYNFTTNSINREDVGIGRRDTIIYYPLTSRVLLELLPQNDNCKHFENFIMGIGNKKLKFIKSLNTLQLLGSHSQVFMHPRYSFNESTFYHF
ncbi:TPA: DUF4238 domain-containing protein [Streptococcus suis 2524]|uniref:DUF4238 domain-containing protein n=1 Tax=Streptococcus suis TaxID=1307 RepID=UPI0003FDD645|nr:DUF4238 domain-containing protein [Streptococcus suis]MDY7284481.1 DUF4238 domain-containing protein [Streptococcus suis]NQG78357.1 DUF4238 domain-containing protein [Streptococcus suis]NQH60794.1 DUF4238 domain-containing protein [Streptococcus suis]NQN48290.1 DUF4238 domain-containing protein [Streptococcus suis]NQN56297.1 DUF4238 domain-containing protein [Streptococcus suis]